MLPVRLTGHVFGKEKRITFLFLTAVCVCIREKESCNDPFHRSSLQKCQFHIKNLCKCIQDYKNICLDLFVDHESRKLSMIQRQKDINYSDFKKESFEKNKRVLLLRVLKYKHYKNKIYSLWGSQHMRILQDKS